MFLRAAADCAQTYIKIKTDSYNAMKTIMKLGVLTILACVAFGGAFVQAQQDQRNRFDRGQFMERIMERLRENLGASVEEWSVLKPMIAKITEKQSAMRRSAGRGAFGAFGGGRGGRGGDNDGDRRGREDRRSRGDGDSESNADSLREAVESGDVDKIKKELASYRAAQKKRAAELKKAREELRQAVTSKQEAILVLWGLLD